MAEHNAAPGGRYQAPVFFSFQGGMADLDGREELQR